MHVHVTWMCDNLCVCSYSVCRLAALQRAESGDQPQEKEEEEDSDMPANPFKPISVSDTVPYPYCIYACIYS